MFLSGGSREDPQYNVKHLRLHTMTCEVFGALNRDEIDEKTAQYAQKQTMAQVAFGHNCESKAHADTSVR